ncbi:MAG: DNA polymerase III subunit alpha [Syntrophomonadaceae bacterium]
MSFVHLHAHSSFSFLDGSSSVEKMVKQAARLQMPALAITDHNNVCAAVKFSRAAAQAGIKPIQGAEVTLVNGTHLTLLARNARGYASLCSLLTKAHLSNPRSHPLCDYSELAKLQDVIVLSGCRRGEIPSLILTGRYQEAYEKAVWYISLWGRDNFYIELQNNFLPGNTWLNHRLLELAETLHINPVATNNVHYCEYADFILHDVLTCVRTLCQVSDIHPERPLNGENYMKSPAAMQDLFGSCLRAVSNTLKIAGECEPVFDYTEKHLPCFHLPPGQKASQYLRHLTLAGAKKRYPRLTRPIQERLDHELRIIEKMGFADYFLVVWDLARFARQQGIRYAGRGSAADSLVAYCLFITEVDSMARGLLFERFISPERAELPDIDIDFEARRRSQVIEYVYSRYGHDRVARVATYNTFKARSALRDLGKALGFAPEELDTIAKKLPHIYADSIRHTLNKLPELSNSPLKEQRFELLLDLCEKVAGFPRFLGMHLGGLVISNTSLNRFTPLQRSALGPLICQFDKDDVEELGLVKLDLLSLRTLSVVQNASRSIMKNDESFNYDKIPLDDPATYEMIAAGKTIGVFQLESPAQRALQSRLEARTMEDMVASLALIRPGPIKGNMVEPYIARRQGKEAITYLHPLLAPILDKTYGVVLFQEQVIEIARTIAGFTAGEADQLRRVMTHARSQQVMEEIGDKFVNRAIDNGIDKEIAREIFACIKGYASYGFCEAHAAAFAATSFKTAYLLKHYPAQYYAAILNNQPMGYYPPRIIANEARCKGILILPPDINNSDRDFTVQEGNIRIGLKQVKGMENQCLDSIITARKERPFSSPQDFIWRCAVHRDIAENLIKCGALDSLYSNRRQLLASLPIWLEKKKLIDQGQPVLFENAVPSLLPDYSPKQKRIWEYSLLGMDIQAHFMAALRSILKKQNIKSSRDLYNLRPGSMVVVSGLLLRPHRPPTRSGKITVFLSLEDEFGLIDVTVFEDVYMQYGRYIFTEQTAPLVIKGILQKRGKGISILARQITFWDAQGSPSFWPDFP